MSAEKSQNGNLKPPAGTDAPKVQRNLNPSKGFRELRHGPATVLYSLFVQFAIRTSIRGHGAVDDARFLGRNARGNVAVNVDRRLAGLASSLAI